MAISIGEAVSLSNPENETITPDDRQQTIEIIGGVAVQDFGHIEAGDKIMWTLTFNADNWTLILNYWNNRTLVVVTDAGGTSFYARVVVKSYRRTVRFESHITAQIELWRV